MMNIKYYMEDGANWQAQAVLAFIRSHTCMAIEKTYNEKYNDYGVTISVGRYENCREQGYVFTINFVGEDRETKKRHFYQRNYAVYEHRNSDKLIVLISNTHTINTPGIDDMWKDKGENCSKFDYDKSFHCGEIIECSVYVLEDMKQFIEEHYLFDKVKES